MERPFLEPARTLSFCRHYRQAR